MGLRFATKFSFFLLLSVVFVSEVSALESEQPGARDQVHFRGSFAALAGTTVSSSLAPTNSVFPSLGFSASFGGLYRRWLFSLELITYITIAQNTELEIFGERLSGDYFMRRLAFSLTARYYPNMDIACCDAYVIAGPGLPFSQVSVNSDRNFGRNREDKLSVFANGFGGLIGVGVEVPRTRWFFQIQYVYDTYLDVDLVTEVGVTRERIQKQDLSKNEFSQHSILLSAGVTNIFFDQ